jgi:hypothetical protein
MPLAEGIQYVEKETNTLKSFGHAGTLIFFKGR